MHSRYGSAFMALRRLQKKEKEITINLSNLTVHTYNEQMAKEFMTK
jgi:hypothetical protein